MHSTCAFNIQDGIQGPAPYRSYATFNNSITRKTQGFNKPWFCYISDISIGSCVKMKGILYKCNQYQIESVKCTLNRDTS